MFHYYDETPITVNPHLITMLKSTDKAIVLQQLIFWVKVNARNKQNFRDGKYWTYNTKKEWVSEFFPWISTRTFQRYIAEFKKLGIVETWDQMSQRGNYIETVWYTVIFDKLNSLPDQLGYSFGEPQDTVTPPEPASEPAPQDTVTPPNGHGVSVNNYKELELAYKDDEEDTTTSRIRETLEFPVDMTATEEWLVNYVRDKECPMIMAKRIARSQRWREITSPALHKIVKAVNESASTGIRNVKKWLDVVIENAILAVEMEGKR